ncbi:DinB family protein [Bacillus sp. 03113]|uniref:DinB family protein n=1 Tax=Bacillus sp. 03113 TaxID=2578211 RepID=UPI0011450C35|nr:DinB family protein [Bacillus sp. 03113]
MHILFEYNWQVRKEWLEWCTQLTNEELLLERVGGVGSILRTFVHIIDVEYSWIRDLQGKADCEINIDDYNTIEKVKELSESFHSEIKGYLQSWSMELDNKIVRVSWSKEEYTAGEILRHIIAHEIHHIGQLSVWSRELGLQPVSANLVGRNLFDKER